MTRAKAEMLTRAPEAPCIVLLIGMYVEMNDDDDDDDPSDSSIYQLPTLPAYVNGYPALGQRPGWRRRG